MDNDGDAVGDVSFQFRFQQILASGAGVALPIGDKMVGIPLEIAGAISASSQAAANFGETYSLDVVSGDSRTGTRNSAVDATSGETSFVKPLDFIGDKTFSGSQGYIDYVSALHNSGKAYNDFTLIAPQNFPRTDLVAAFLTGFEGVNQLASITPSEMLRLNTGIAATAADAQSNLGVAAGDLAGFPNRRRPGDDVTDLALRVVMGALCHNIAVDLNGDTVLDDADNLNVCGGETAADNEASAPAGAVAFGDGAPQNAAQFDTSFPYLRAPNSGSTASN